jgi:PP-loop superfamily ATP-utilizing enzyme
LIDVAIVDKTLDRKFADLKKLVSGYGSLIVAYSGGVDSTFLAAIAHEVLGATLGDREVTERVLTPNTS